MALKEKQLRQLAKEVLDRQRELLYGDSCSEDQRISIVEKLIIEFEKGLSGNDPKKVER